MPTAKQDGVYVVNGIPFVVAAGDEYPEDAEFRASDFPAPEELPAPKDEESSSSDPSKRARGAAPENR